MTFFKLFMILFSMVLSFSLLAYSSLINTQTQEPPGKYFQHMDCDSSLNPLVLVHGFLASGDSYEKQALRFIKNGWCLSRIFIFDWNTIGPSGNTELLSEYIVEVLEKTGAEKIYLVGHSAGSNLSISYLSQEKNAKNVAAYVHLAGSAQSSPAGPKGEIPTLNLYSDGDLIVPGKDITGAENLRFEVKDHYQVATSRKTFEALYRFFRERDPKKERTMYEAGEPILIGGKTVSLGTNNSQKNAEIQVYELDSNTGFRMDDRPLKKIVSDENGNWGPFKGKAGVHYEFLLIPEGNHQRKIHYYRTPFYSDNPFVYLRALPPSGSMAGMLLAGLPKDDNQSIAAIFTANQAVIHGRDQLIIDDIELSTSAFAPASANHIAWFLYDANFNKATDAEAIPAFQMAPFLTGVDVFFPTQNPQTITATFNGEKLNFRNWKSGSDGIVVLVFD